MAERKVLDINGIEYSVSETGGNRYIQRIAPYDETEYHWAYYSAAKKQWTIYRGKATRESGFRVYTNSETVVAKACKDNDDALGLKRTGGIW